MFIMYRVVRPLLEAKFIQYNTINNEFLSCKIHMIYKYKMHEMSNHYPYNTLDIYRIILSALGPLTLTILKRVTHI